MDVKDRNADFWRSLLRVLLKLEEETDEGQPRATECIAIVPMSRSNRMSQWGPHL